MTRFAPVTRGLRLLAVVLTLVSGHAFAESKPAEDHGGSGDGKPGGSYLELDALTVTLFRNDAPAGAVTARIVLQMRSSEALGAAGEARVRLRDALLREMFRMAEREAGNGPKIDLDLVKRRLLKVAQRTLGPELVDDVLVQSLLRRGA